MTEWGVVEVIFVLIGTTMVVLIPMIQKSTRHTKAMTENTDAIRHLTKSLDKYEARNEKAHEEIVARNDKAHEDIEARNDKAHKDIEERGEKARGEIWDELDEHGKRISCIENK